MDTSETEKLDVNAPSFRRSRCVLLFRLSPLPSPTNPGLGPNVR